LEQALEPDSALLQKGKNVSIKAGEIFEIETIKNVILPPEDF
jgi:hypothetical protein